MQNDINQPYGDSELAFYLRCLLLDALVALGANLSHGGPRHAHGNSLLEHLCNGKEIVYIQNLVIFDFHECVAVAQPYEMGSPNVNFLVLKDSHADFSKI